MDVRSIISLFLGLVIQFSQVPSRAADLPVSPCANTAVAMACCKGIEACPCVKDTSQNRRPAPAIPATAALKLVIAKSSESNGAGAAVPRISGTASRMDSQTEFRNGYAGVPLAVAFCSYVI